MKKTLKLFFIFLSSLLLFSCQTTNVESSFEYFIDCVDLDSEDLQICGKLDEEKSFDLMDFVNSKNLSYAINTTPWQETGKTKKILGVYKYKNETLSEPIEKYSALGFFTNSEGKLRAKIITNQTEAELCKMTYAFGGYFTILINGEVQTFEEYYHSRSAVGTDESGRYLYFFICTSNLASDNSGMTYAECAKILKEYDCSDAIQFDGGHSSALYSEKIGYKHAKLNKKIPAAFGFSTTK